MDVSVKPVKHFLDSADTVLNSNTFILDFYIVENNIEESLKRFILSADFITQIMQQDKDRDWHIFHYFDTISDSFKVKSGSLIEPGFHINISQPPCDKWEYLTAMLTGDTSKGRFFSFYKKEIEKDKAGIIIDNLIAYLTQYSGAWDLFIVSPNFLKYTEKTYPKGEELNYFEGEFGNDTATVISYKDNGFLILTNGID